MKITSTEIQDCFIIEPTLFKDERGYFFESYNQQKFKEQTGLSPNFVQDNQSKSNYGVIRGLHTQLGDYAQAKLVRVLEGTVIDVAVDARKNSPTFGKVVQIELSEENKKQLFIPRGCLHGFSVISDVATFFYKCDNFYYKASETSVNPLDAELQIDWKIPFYEAIISEKDKNALNWQKFLKA